MTLQTTDTTNTLRLGVYKQTHASARAYDNQKFNK